MKEGRGLLRSRFHRDARNDVCDVSKPKRLFLAIPTKVGIQNPGGGLDSCRSLPRIAMRGRNGGGGGKVQEGT